MDEARQALIGEALGPKRAQLCLSILLRVGEEITSSMNPEKFEFVCSQLDEAISLMRAEAQDGKQAGIKKLEQLHLD